MDTTKCAEEQFKKDNHYVPRLTLKRWADAEGKVNAYRLLVPHENIPLWKRQSTKAIAYHEHLYTRVLATGETDEIETWLDREFETPAEAPLRKVSSGARLTREDWECIIRFAAAQDVRTPARMLEIMDRAKSPEMGQHLQKMFESSVKDYEAAIRENRPIQRPPTQGAEYFPGRVTTGIESGTAEGFIKAEMIAGRAYWLFSMRHVLTTTLEALLQHRWTILRPPLHMHWLTSDDPLVKLNFHSPTQYDFKGGWGTQGTEIFLPLDPRHMLFTKVGERRLWDRNHRVPADLALGFQRFTIEHAHRLVFSIDDDPLVAQIKHRRVDPAACNLEREHWKKWATEQGDAERSLLRSATT